MIKYFINSTKREKLNKRAGLFNIRNMHSSFQKYLNTLHKYLKILNYNLKDKYL